jgi:hypothetical protein
MSVQEVSTLIIHKEVKNKCKKCITHPNAVSLPGLAPQQTHRHTRGTEYAKQEENFAKQENFLRKQKYSYHSATNISVKTYRADFDANRNNSHIGKWRNIRNTVH